MSPPAPCPNTSALRSDGTQSNPIEGEEYLEAEHELLGRILADLGVIQR